MRKLLPYGAKAFLCLLLVGMSSWLYAGTPLSGAYTINTANPASSTNFTSFTMAADSLTTNGVSGAVTITVSAGVYNEYMTLGAIAGASSSNTITFDGGDTATTSIVHDGSTENHTILLDGAKWVTISNLKIVNSKTTDDAWGVRIANESDNATISNCRIQMGVVTAFEDIAGILANGSATASSTEGAYGDNITITNTAILDGYYGMRLESQSTYQDTNFTVNNTWMNNNIGYGMYVDNVVGLNLTGNKVEGASLTSKDGYYIFDIIDFNITANKIDVPDFGIYISDGNFDLTLPATRSQLVNNMIASSDDEAIYLDDFQQCDVFHNTCATLNPSQAFAYGSYLNDLDDVVIKNNIFYSAGSYAFYSVDDLSASTTVTVDYNNYYTGGANLAYLSFSNVYADLAAWQLGDATNNVNSVEGDPVFGIGTDLHVSGATANDVGDNSVGITVDIDGDTRPLAPSTVVDMGADEFAAATCQQPSALSASNITSSSADLTWTTGGASNWQIQYGTSGFTIGSGTVMSAAAIPATISGLSADTDYDFYVKDSCSTTDVSGYSGPFSFRTLCVAYNTFPWVENFDAAASIPNCWENEAGDNSDWLFRSGNIGHGSTSDNTTGSGNYAGVDDSHSNANDTVNNLLTPSFDLTSLTSPRLNFYHFFGNDNVLTSTLYIDVYDGTSWNMAVATIGYTMAAWQQEFVDLTAYKSTNSRIRFRVHETTDFNSDVSIDDVTIEETPACIAPTGLMTYGVTANDVWVTWTSAGSSFEVEYGPLGFTSGAGTTMSSTNDTLNIISLNASTDYDVYVREICGVGDTSAWVGPVSFTTLCSTFPAPFLESFDGSSTPNCWSQAAVSGGPWVFGSGFNSVTCAAATDNTGNGGSYAWMDQSGGDASVSISTPEIDVTSLTVPYLEFYYWMCGVSYTPINMTIIETWDGTAWVYLDTLDFATAGWEAQGYDLTGRTYGSNLVKVRFTAESGGSTSDFYGDNALDDIAIKEAPSCIAPSNLSAYNMSDTSAILTWTGGGASNWNIEIGLAGFTPGTGTMLTATNDTLGLIGFAAGTQYEYYVQDSCGIGNVSPWVGPYLFTTTNSCPAIEAIPYFENFDASEGCFTSIDGGVGTGDSWAHTINGGQNLDGTGYMRVDSDANGNGTHMIETLESPVFDASAIGNGLLLEFDHYYRAIGADSGTVQVYDGTAWVNVATFTASTGAFGAPTHEIIDVTAYANAAFQVRFHYDDANSWAWYWAVDNFSLEDKCPVQPLPYTNNFDADASCFRVGDGGGATGDTWAHTINAGQNLDGTGYMRVDSDANGNGVELFEVLRSADINATGITGTLMLEFDHYFRSIGAADTGWVNVWDGSAWNNVLLVTATTGAWGSPTHEMIDISAYANDFLSVEFIYSDGNSWAWYWSVDNFSVAEVGCLQPTALGVTNVAQTTTDVFWTTGGASNWNVEYGPAGFTPGTGTMVAATNDTLNLTGLTAATTYDVYVQDSCGVGSVSTWLGPISFTTTCAVFAAPYTESFDGTSTPNCWSETAVSGGPWLYSTGNNSVNCPQATDNTGNSGNYAWMDQSGADASVSLITPEIDVTSLTVPYLEFYYWMCGVGYSPVNMTIVETWDGTAWVYLDTLDIATAGWEVQGYDLTGRTYGSNLVKVRFTAESGGSGSDFFGDNAIDDVSIMEKPSCAAPSNLSVFNINDTAAAFAWTGGGASNWNFEIGLAGFTPGTGFSFAFTNDTVGLQGFAPGTQYEFYVQDSCGLGDVSAWVGPVLFATTIACPPLETIPFYENFDISEGCFDTIDGGAASGDGWAYTVNATQNLDGTGYMRVDSDADGNGVHLIETMESPVFDASSLGNGLILEFDHYYRAIGPDSGAVQVYDGTAWVTVATYTASVGAFGAPAHEVIDVTPYANAAFQVRFHYDDGNSWAWYWSVDNFQLEDKCPTQPLPYTNNFDLDASCFRSADLGAAVGDGWAHTINATQNLDGTGYMRVDSDLNGNGVEMRELLFSPSIDASSITGTLMLDFDHYYRTIGLDTGWVNVWDGSAWNTVAMFTTNTGAWGAPDHQSIDITAYANDDLQVMFEYYDGNQWAWYWSVDNFSVAEVGCVAPSALGMSAATQTTADVYWTGGGAANWNVEYGPTGFTPGTGTLLAVTNDTISISGLMAATCYDFYVQDSCGLGDVSSWTGPFNFCTACGPFMAPITESFDGTSTPLCWTEYAVAGGPWLYSTGLNSVNCPGAPDHTGNNGNYAWMDQSGTDTLVTLEMNDVDVSALTTPYLEFFYWMCGSGYTPINKTIIETWDGTNWVLLDTLTLPTVGWERQGYSLAGRTYGANLVKVRFTAESGRSGSDFFGDNGLDDISIIEEPACLNPTNFMVTGNTINTIDLMWNSDTNIISSNIEYGPIGFTPGTGTSTTSSPGSTTISGLSPGTCYEFYVQDVCSANTAWVGPIIGCTGSICSVTTMPTTVGDSANCGGGPITLTGTAGSGDIAWMLNGTVLGTGNTYSDSIGGTTLYDAADYSVVAPAVHLGPLTSIAGAGFGNFSNGQYFTVMDTIYIDSTTVRANGFVEGSVIILDDAGGNLVQIGDTFTTGTTLGDYQVPVGVLLTPGNYFMGIDFHASTTGQLFRATSGAAYPYILPGLMSIDSVNFAGARYYYTFDLVVSGACLGSPVQTIGYVPGANSGTSDTVDVCETDAAVNLASFLGPHDNGGTWVDLDASGALTDSIFNATLADTNNYYSFNYILGATGGCSFGDTATITVLVNFQRSAGTDGADTLCSDVTQLISLNQYLGSHTGGGSWTDLDTSGALLGIRIRPSNVNAPGTYRYRYTVASNGACPGESSIVTITYTDPVDAGMDNSVTICNDTSVAVDLNDYLSAGASTGGTWLDLDAAGGLAGSMLTASVPAHTNTYTFAYALESAGCGNDTAFISVFIEECDISLDEQDSYQFNVYPNPTTGVFFIESLGSTAKDMRIEVYSVNGQLLKTNKFVGYNETNTVDLTDLAKGVYNVKVFTEYGVEVHRITKQ